MKTQLAAASNSAAPLPGSAVPSAPHGLWLPRLIVAALCLAVLMARAAPRVLQAHLWAEDGVIFLHDALEMGLRSVVTPYASYFHTLPRLVAMACVCLPLRAYAAATTSMCFVLYAFIFSQFSAAKYAWLVPKLGWRICICVMMCLTPGLSETLGNLANLHTGCLLYLCLVAMQRLDAPLGKLQMLAIFFSAATEGSAFVLVPAYVSRLILLRHRNIRSPILMRQNTLATVIVLASLVSSYAASWQNRVVAPDFSWTSLAASAADTPWLILDRFIAAPIFGPHINACLQRGLPQAFYHLTVPLMLALVYRLILGHRGAAALVLLPCLAIAGHYLLMWSVRPGAHDLFKQLELIGPLRHSAASGLLSIVFICAGIAALPRARGTLLALYLWLSMTLAAQNFFLGAISDARGDWAQAADAITAARASPHPAEVVIPIMPHEFLFIYRNKAMRTGASPAAP